MPRRVRCCCHVASHVLLPHKEVNHALSIILGQSVVLCRQLISQSWQSYHNQCVHVWCRSLALVLSFELCISRSTNWTFYRSTLTLATRSSHVTGSISLWSLSQPVWPIARSLPHAACLSRCHAIWLSVWYSLCLLLCHSLKLDLQRLSATHSHGICHSTILLLTIL